MDQDTVAVKAFLASMIPVKEAIHTLARDLRNRPGVQQVTGYFPELYPWSDFGVSAELHNGAIVDFWISLWDESGCWQIDYSVLRGDPDEDGSHKELEFPIRSVLLAMDLSPTLLVVIVELREAIANDVFFR